MHSYCVNYYREVSIRTYGTYVDYEEAVNALYQCSEYFKGLAKVWIEEV